MKLHIIGRLKINDTPEKMQRLAELVEEFEAPVKLEQDHGWWLAPRDVHADDEDTLKNFLARVARELPGLLVGSLEIWWPFAIESGPQKWEMDALGHLLVSESDITWAPAQIVEG